MVKLQEECKKILDYIEKQEKKEQDRLERAKIREKEKAEVAKKEKEERSKQKAEKNKDGQVEESKEKDEKLVIKTDVKKEKGETPKRSLPVPQNKEKLAAALKIPKKDIEPEIIVLDNNEDVKKKIPHFQHHRAVHYKPDINTGVEKVVKGQGNVLQVTVGPKMPVPVQTPYKDGLMPKVIHPVRAGGPVIFPKINNVKTPPGLNDIEPLTNAIGAFNVEHLSDKLQTATQSFSLSLNALKTDLRIAILSNSNPIKSRNLAVFQMKNCMGTYFNSVRTLFNAKIEATLPSSDIVKSIPTVINATGASKGEKVEDAIVVDDDGAKSETTEDSMNGSLVVLSDNDEKTNEKDVKKPAGDEFVVELNEEFNNTTETNSGEKEKIKKKDDVEEETKETENEETEEVMEVDTEDEPTVDTEDEPTVDTEDEPTVDTEDEPTESKGENDVDVNDSKASENTAAKMELLKEMEDELEDEQESVPESKQSRRTTRNSLASEEKVDSKPQHSSSKKQKSSKTVESDEDGSAVSISETDEKSQDNVTEKKGKNTSDKNTKDNSPKKSREQRKGSASSEKTDDKDEDDDKEIESNKISKSQAKENEKKAHTSVKSKDTVSNTKKGGKKDVSNDSDSELEEKEKSETKGKKSEKTDKAESKSTKKGGKKDVSNDSDSELEEKEKSETKGKKSEKTDKSESKSTKKGGKKDVSNDSDSELEEKEKQKTKGNKSEKADKSENKSKGKKSSEESGSETEVDGATHVEDVAENSDISDDTESEGSEREFGKRKKTRRSTKKGESEKTGIV